MNALGVAKVSIRGKIIPVLYLLPFWYRLTQVVLEKRPLIGSSSNSSSSIPRVNYPLREDCIVVAEGRRVTAGAEFASKGRRGKLDAGQDTS